MLMSPQGQNNLYNTWLLFKSDLCSKDKKMYEMTIQSVGGLTLHIAACKEPTMKLADRWITVLLNASHRILVKYC